MAEAMGAVGAAASFVQLTDVSIRTCLYLYSFFSSLHKAQNEFQRHIIVLRDVHDSIQLIRQTTASQPFPPAEETALRKHLLSITHELSTLEKATAGKNPAKLSARLKWAMKSTETDRTLQELERRKTSLILLLQSITLRHSAQSRGNHDSHQTMINSLGSLVEDHGIATRSEISSRFDRLSLEMAANRRMYKESLDEAFSTLTRDREVTFPEECMEQVLRRVLDSYILPRVEECFSRTSELQNTATIRLIQEAMGQATEQILSHIVDINKHDDGLGPQPYQSPRYFEQEDQVSAERFETEPKVRTPPYIPPSGDNEANSKITRRGVFRSLKRREWSHWTSVSAVGTFLFQYGSQMGDSGRFWTMQVDFWPSITFLSRRCISLKYGNNYDPHGYMALFPSLALYPIISDDHPIWHMIEAGDMGSIRVQFQDHNVGPYDQDSHGISLLTYSFRVCRLEVAQFLLIQGADPTRTTVCNRDGLQDLIYYTMNNLIQPRTMCLACHLSYWMDFSLFCSIFHDLLASGCDLDDCDINILRCLEDHRFADLELNQYGIGDTGYLRLRDRYNDPMREEKGETLEIPPEHNFAQVSAYSGRMSLSEEDSYLARIRRVAEFLRRQGLDLIEEPGCSRVPELLKGAQRMTFPVLLECGLDADYRDPSRDHMASILYHGLHCSQISNSKFLMDNLVSMIRHGADIYDMEWAGEDWLNKVADDGVMSVTAYAKATDCAPFWRHALKHAGYDPDDVFLEDERRRREFRRLHGAASSAVEVEDPPNSALRRRLV